MEQGSIIFLNGTSSLVHAHDIYDLEVDTSILTAMECAEQIKERLLNGSPPNAFQQLQASL